mmetsp:Transcript_24006/g.71211  ORF Transcript_24006/g.71211 Transcript_24006/m.71211 type:complete len:281 (-) Transcript_24006:12-854(-)
MRRLPPPISTPLYTRSYARAFACLKSPLASASSLGAVNGWCTATYRRSSASYSNIGKSTTHSRLCCPGAAKPYTLFATYCRTRSSAASTVGFGPAAMSSRSPGFAPAAATTAAACASLRPSLIGLAASIVPPSPTRMNARPAAPAATASAATSPLGLRRLLEMALPSGTRQQRTVPPSSSAAEKTRKPHPRTASDRSDSSSPYRKSGLSLPYLSIASSYVMRRNGAWMSMPATFLNTAATSPSISVWICTSSINATSRSSCVNSGWRSARRSSSRKQRAI